jgi:Response regulators consisting of a CheY-like receiver domain and a winged-helix DNA-binding domain
VVDDNADTLELVSFILEEYGTEVITAASAIEAIAAIAQSQPNILISDIAMPGIDGYSLIRKVRTLSSERGGQIPAIALTAYASKEEGTRLLDSGFQMHIAKPVDPAELVAVVANLAQTHLELDER